MSLKKDWRKNKRDPLSLDIKETTKTIVKGAIIIGLGIPLISGLFGGD